MKTNFIFPYLHGFIFSLSACLSVYITMRDATTFAPPSEIARPTAGTLLAYLVIALLAYLISRDHDTSGLTATSMILGTVYLWNTFVVTVIASILTWSMLVFISKKRISRNCMRLLRQLECLSWFILAQPTAFLSSKTPGANIKTCYQN